MLLRATNQNDGLDHARVLDLHIRDRSNVQEELQSIQALWGWQTYRRTFAQVKPNASTKMTVSKPSKIPNMVMAVACLIFLQIYGVEKKQPVVKAFRGGGRAKS